MRKVRKFVLVPAIMLVVLGMIALLLAGPASVAISALVGAEDERDLRSRLESANALSNLKRWASDRVSSSLAWEGTVVEKERMPSDLHELGIVDLYPAMSDDRRIQWIIVRFGCGHRDYGLLVGPTGFTPLGDERRVYLNRWCDQVWFFDDAPSAIRAAASK